MSKRVLVSFKDNELENKLYEYLQKQSELIGPTAYIKQLIFEDMNRKSPEKK